MAGDPREGRSSYTLLTNIAYLSTSEHRHRHSRHHQQYARHTRKVLEAQDDSKLTFLVCVVCVYSLRNVERRPVLCFFKRIEGGLFYQKNLLGRARLYVLHSTAASLPVIRVSRPRKHPRASRVASEWPSVFRTPFGPDQATCVTVRVDIHTS